MIRKNKAYRKPMKPFETERIKEENVLKEKYGLKNKKEVWRAIAKVNYYRRRAKDMAKLPIEEQEVLFNKLRALGLQADGTADVLGMKVEDILERRLPTVVLRKKLANTASHARQMVVHKKILIDGRVVNSPSYLVPVSEESMISIKDKKKVFKGKVGGKKEEAVVSDESAAVVEGDVEEAKGEKVEDVQKEKVEGEEK
jgi:small subunit ribosomal protein S4